MPSREVTEAKLNKHLRLESRAAPLPRHADTLWSQGTHRRALRMSPPQQVCGHLRPARVWFWKFLGHMLKGDAL